VGLGLAICRAIIRAHGGEIEAHTRASGGTQIELTLRRGAAVTQAMHQILVIEDDASIREVLHALLGSVGFRVVEAATAQRADIEARAHKPDLLLVDLGLPDGDGTDVIRAVRSLVIGAHYRALGADHGGAENRRT